MDAVKAYAEDGKVAVMALKAGNDMVVTTDFETQIPQVIAAVRAEAALGLRTLKFVSVEVDGGRAVAVIEYDSKRENGAIKTEIGTIDLRKINGEWKFYRCVYKDK